MNQRITICLSDYFVYAQKMSEVAEWNKKNDRQQNWDLATYILRTGVTSTGKISVLAERNEAAMNKQL